MLTVSSHDDSARTPRRPLRAPESSAYPSSLPVPSSTIKRTNSRRAPAEVIDDIRNRRLSAGNSGADGSPRSSIPLRVSQPKTPTPPSSVQSHRKSTPLNRLSAGRMNPRASLPADPGYTNSHSNQTGFVNPKSMRRRSGINIASGPAPPRSSQAQGIQNSEASNMRFRRNSRVSGSSPPPIVDSTIEASESIPPVPPLPEQVSMPKVRKFPSGPRAAPASYMNTRSFSSEIKHSSSYNSFNDPRFTASVREQPEPLSPANMSLNQSGERPIAPPLSSSQTRPHAHKRYSTASFPYSMAGHNEELRTVRPIHGDEKRSEPFKSSGRQENFKLTSGDRPTDEFRASIRAQDARSSIRPIDQFRTPLRPSVHHEDAKMSLGSSVPAGQAPVATSEHTRPGMFSSTPSSRQTSISPQKQPSSPRKSIVPTEGPGHARKNNGFRMSKSHTLTDIHSLADPTPPDNGPVASTNSNAHPSSPYRPLNRPALIHPQVPQGKLDAAKLKVRNSGVSGDDKKPTTGLARMRSKSTAASKRAENNNLPYPPQGSSAKPLTPIGRAGQSSVAAMRRILTSPFVKDKQGSASPALREPTSAKSYESLKAMTTGSTTSSGFSGGEDGTMPELASVRSNTPSSAPASTPPPPAISEEAKKIAEMMRKLVTAKADDSTTRKRLDELRKKDALKPQSPMTPAMATKSCRLNLYEKGEILDFRKVYFCGRPDIKKTSSDVRRTIDDSGFDDENGDYKVVPGDHIAYRYEILSVLGKGSFGKVLKCLDHRTGRLAAIKMIINRKRFQLQALVEADILRTLSQHDPNNRHHLVRYGEHFNFREHLCISTELLGINLYELIKYNGFKGLPVPLVRHFTKQVLEGLDFMASRTIIHCDLKPENILLCDPERGGVKIIDFGSSCYESEKVYTYIQSRFYRSPEVMLGMVYNKQIDIWSLGCIVSELITGRPLFIGENEQEQIACIMEFFGVPDRAMISRCSRRKVFFDSLGNPRPYKASSSKKRLPNSRTLARELKTNDGVLIDFVSAFLEWNPRKRITASQALRHEFITGVRPARPQMRSASSIASLKGDVADIMAGSAYPPLRDSQDIRGSGLGIVSYKASPRQMQMRTPAGNRP